MLALEPFCQAEVPGGAAVLACAHFCRASSLGGTSISLTQRSVARDQVPAADGQADQGDQGAGAQQGGPGDQRTGLELRALLFLAHGTVPLPHPVTTPRAPYCGQPHGIRNHSGRLSRAVPGWSMIVAHVCDTLMV